ncbi:MAG: hypothetical protein EOP51_04620 [Sphingobacteriales bacterium]|nr:MAG: hypothetical protein EOP51_04620 [Sphingobacteriales bacterium]
MSEDTNKPEEQKKKTDPQEDEKDGNVFGKAFDKVFGDKDGGGSVSDEEANDPDKQESIKDSK